MKSDDGHDRDIDGECWHGCAGCAAERARAEMQALALVLDQTAPPVADAPFSLSAQVDRSTVERQESLF